MNVNLQRARPAATRMRSVPAAQRVAAARLALPAMAPSTTALVRRVFWHCLRCLAACADSACGVGRPTAAVTKLGTVSSTSTSAVCSGIATAASTCSACANLGKGTVLTGSTSATCVIAANSPCCNLPVFYLDFTGSTATRYPLIEFNVLTNVRAGIAPARAARRG